MAIKIRTVGPDEIPAFFGVGGIAFSDEWDPDEMEAERGLMATERMVTAEDDGTLVAQGGAFEFDMSVPGGSVPTAGVTWIGVLPTHRRRGILTGMMTHIHEMAHHGGEPLAALWAAESLIYPRFGYGLAAPDQEIEIARGQTAWAKPAEPAGVVRLIEARAAAAVFAPVYDRELGRRPGMVPRDEQWWKVRLLDSKERRAGASQLFHVVHEGSSGIDGYVAYRVKHDYSTPLSGGLVKVVELIANSDDAYRALWGYCFNIDLTARIQARHRPMDDPLAWMLADYRQLEVRPLDALWVRLVDVDAALAARRYSASDAVVFDVIDGQCPWNAGRHRLEGGPDGATCAPSDTDPDLRLDVRDLGATYLGGVEFGLLAAAGRLEECRPGAIARADAMFRWRPLPWCPGVF
jgi:predicted acetyltransferase